MRKTNIVLFVALVATTGSALAATATSTVTARIADRVITLTNTRGLNFGEILPFSIDGWVQVNANGTSTVSNTQVIDSTSLTSSAWSVSGVPFGLYSITLPVSNTVTISNGTNQMQLANFFRDGPSQPGLNSSGAGGFSVGARLQVGANQPPGEYTGTFDVTVNYL